MVIVVMGVAGCGKSTVGALLASHLQWEFLDADGLHSPSSIDKMRRGIPLADEDRWPWLARVAEWIDTNLSAGGHVVVACSALRRSYREILIGGRNNVRLVYLKGDESLITRRAAARHGHFMPHNLVRSQFDILEEPDSLERPIIVSIEEPPREIVDRILRAMSTGHRDVN
jgi:carbohydrate kinase (thermoresistant glucokinase family)